MTQELQTIDLSAIHAAEDNPREDLGDIEELAASIRAQGLIEPPVVAPNQDGFVVVAGHRRLAALRLIGASSVDAIVRELDERGRREAMLVENLQRKDLSPLEEARGYKGLVDLDVAQKDIAERVGRSQAHVSKRLGLLELPGVAQMALSTGKISLDDAFELRVLKDMPKITAEAIKLGKDWGNMPRAIETTIRAHERARKIGEAAQKLKQAGVRVVEEPVYNDKTKRLGGGYQGIELDGRSHKKEPCHAAYVDPRDYKPVTVCTDPSRHTKKGASELKLPAKEKTEPRSKRKLPAKESPERVALKEASERRLAFVKDLVENLRGKKVAKEDIYRYVARAAVVGLCFDDATESDVFLGLFPALKSKKPYATLDNEKVNAWVAESQANLLRLSLALGLFAAEYSCGGYGEFGRFGWHFDFLVRYGYELSPIEKKKFGKTTA